MLSWALTLLLAFTDGHLDVWFESDSVYILSQITDRLSEWNQSNGSHPVYPLIGFGSMWLLGDLLGLDDAVGARLLLLTSGALFTASAYLALRLLGRRRPVALLFTAVLLLASPGILFLGIHERHLLGGVTVLLMIAAVAAWRRGLISHRPVVAAAALSLGITVTNFITAGLLLLAAAGVRQGLKIAAIAFAIVQVLSIVTVLTFPRSTVFPNVGTWPWFSTIWSDSDDILYRAGSGAQKSAVFWMHAVVFPEPVTQDKLIAEPVMRYVSFQHARLNRQRWQAAAALAGWLVGMIAGLALALRGRDPIERALVAALVAQWWLFLLFGEETVLYAPYYVPLAVIVASTAADRWWTNAGVRAALVIMALLLAWNNVQIFMLARAAALTLL